MLTHETVLNLYSNARLSGATLDFLEGIKFQPHDLIDNEKFQIINHVNSDKKLLKH